MFFFCCCCFLVLEALISKNRDISSNSCETVVLGMCAVKITSPVLHITYYIFLLSSNNSTAAVLLLTHRRSKQCSVTMVVTRLWSTAPLIPLSTRFAIQDSRGSYSCLCLQFWGYPFLSLLITLFCLRPLIPLPALTIMTSWIPGFPLNLND